MDNESVRTLTRCGLGRRLPIARLLAMVALASLLLVLSYRPASAQLGGNGNFNLCHFANPDHFQAFERLYEGFLDRISPVVASGIDPDGDLLYHNCDEFYVNYDADRDPPLRAGTALSQVDRELQRVANFRPATLDFSNLGLSGFSWEDDALEALISYHYAAGHIDRLRFSGNPMGPDDVDVAELPDGLLLIFDGGSGTRVGFSAAGISAEEDSRALLPFQFAGVPPPADDDRPGDDRRDICLQITLEDHRQWRVRINADDRIRALYGLVVALPSNQEIEADYQLDLLLDVIPGCIGSGPQSTIDDGDIDEAVLTVFDNDSPTISLCDRSPAVREQIERWLPDHSDCAKVSVADLARVTAIDLAGRDDLPILRAGDFSQLPHLRELDLDESGLSQVPENLLSAIGTEKTLVIDLRNNPGPDGAGFTLANLPAIFRSQIRPGVEVLVDSRPATVTAFDRPIYYAVEGEPLAVGLTHNDRAVAGAIARLQLRARVSGRGAESSDLPTTIEVNLALGEAKLVALAMPEERIDDGEDEDFVLLMIDTSASASGRTLPIIDFASVRLTDSSNYIRPAPPAPQLGAFFGPITVQDVKFLAVPGHEVLAHNITDLRVVLDSGQSLAADFLGHFNRTGGMTRWGYPTSEVLISEPATLTQYYQRGVVDFHNVGAGWLVERRLTWDYFGGGLGNSIDRGVEYGVANPFPGQLVGPWGNRVANRAVDGTVTGFADFFEQLGGVDSFGFPKSEARRDGRQDTRLSIGDPGFVRQFFQAAVFEFHPGKDEPVKLRLLGDDLRNAQFPNGSWRDFEPFLAVTEMTKGQIYRPPTVVIAG